MKTLLTISFVFLSVLSIAQKNNKSVFNTKIDKPGKVVIEGSRETNSNTTNINQIGNQNIGQVIINNSLQSHMLLIGNFQRQDSLGFYHTQYQFKNKENKPSYAIDIALKFNDTIVGSSEKVDCRGKACVFTDNISRGITDYGIYIDHLPVEAILILSFKSRKPLTASISGIYGKI